MNGLGLAVSGTTLALLLAGAYATIRFSDYLALAFQEYIPQPGNDIEQRILHEDEQ